MSSPLPLLVSLGALIVAATPLAAQPAAEPYDRVDLAASAERSVDNDLLVAFVFAEAEDNDQADAADEVNDAIEWATGRARRVDDVEVESAQYQTRPIFANGRRITGWVVRQSLRLESRNASALSELLGELQSRVAIQSLSYDVSKDARDAAEDALIADALAQFNRRAELVARELGRDGFRIVRIGIGTNARPMPIYADARLRVANEELAVTPPTIEAGEQTISVSINGMIELAAP